ncbi:MAG: hypothetical protein GY835_22520 [bacterium]|nr:hypothetical protein [bacterium]
MNRQLSETEVAILHTLGMPYSTATGTTESAIWPHASGGRGLKPSTNTQFYASSASADDDATGTGARTLTLAILDEDGDITWETVTMDGQNAVTITAQGICVLLAEVATAGSGGVNAGIIYIGSDSTPASGVQIPGVCVSVFEAGANRGVPSHITIPTTMPVPFESGGTEKTVKYAMFTEVEAFCASADATIRTGLMKGYHRESLTGLWHQDIFLPVGTGSQAGYRKETKLSPGESLELTGLANSGTLRIGVVPELLVVHTI